jgi:hypothetical protein
MSPDDICEQETIKQDESWFYRAYALRGVRLPAAGTLVYTVSFTGLGQELSGELNGYRANLDLANLDGTDRDHTLPRTK